MGFRLQTFCRLEFEVSVATPMILVLRPSARAAQWVAHDSFEVNPPVALREYHDVFENRCQRLVAPPGQFSIEATAEVQVPDGGEVNEEAPFVDIVRLPDWALGYLLPSRYCESDRAGSLARRIVGKAPLGYPQVLRLRDWIRTEVAYKPGSGEQLLSALEVLERGEGVCRDLAHLLITLCRALSIPARIVVGFAREVNPMDIHAWVEVWLGDRWYGFDPTPGTPIAGRVVLGVGRDGADVPLFNQFGPVLRPSKLEVSLRELTQAP